MTGKKNLKDCKKRNKKEETLSNQGFFALFNLFFFFGHEGVKDFLNHIPFFIGFDLF